MCGVMRQCLDLAARASRLQISWPSPANDFAVDMWPASLLTFARESGRQDTIFALCFPGADDVGGRECDQVSNLNEKARKSDTFLRALLRPFRGTPQYVSPQNRLAFSHFDGVDRVVSPKNTLVGSDIKVSEPDR